jgi:hypothetical protein
MKIERCSWPSNVNVGSPVRKVTRVTAAPVNGRTSGDALRGGRVTASVVLNCEPRTEMDSSMVPDGPKGALTSNSINVFGTAVEPTDLTERTDTEDEGCEDDADETVAEVAPILSTIT